MYVIADIKKNRYITEKLNILKNLKHYPSNCFSKPSCTIVFFSDDNETIGLILQPLNKNIHLSVYFINLQGRIFRKSINLKCRNSGNFSKSPFLNDVGGGTLRAAIVYNGREFCQTKARSGREKILSKIREQAGLACFMYKSKLHWQINLSAV